MRRAWLTASLAAAVIWLGACNRPAPAQQARPKPAPAALYLAARAVLIKPSLYAYATVEPAYTVTVSAAETGVLRGLRVTPGSRVAAGEVLARLEGPGLQQQLLRGEANLRSAQAQWRAAEQTLTVARQQLTTHFGTRQAVNQAESVLARARGAADDAQSALQAVRALQTVAAPAAGTVLRLAASEGALVGAGQPVLTLQPAGQLWLMASFYGADARQADLGMAGKFTPAGSGPAIRVRVVRRYGALTPDGGEPVALAASGPDPGWRSGEYGRVALRARARTLVAVPTRALILDRGRWWVMAHGAGGDKPRAVTPGAARGWDTLIEQGLRAGEEVAVTNAYLLFHRAIAQRFQLPD